MPWSRAKQIAAALRGEGDFPEGYRGSRTLAELTALFVAAGSLFLGQPKVFPPALRGAAVMFIPELAILGLMLFWLARVLLSGAAGRSRPSPSLAV